ncbi:MAG: AAA family ATPase [Terriglobales bacterium]
MSVSSAPPGQMLAPGAELSGLRRKWAIYTPGELRQRCTELNSGTSLIAGLIPQRSLSIVVGDSAIGKSPLLYQAAICVTAGIPFLGRPVSQGRVLYLDFENGLGDVDDLVARLSRHLGLGDKPENLLLWNYNDAPPRWEPTQLACMIREAQPVWTIVDSLGAYAPEIEEKSSNVTRVHLEFRKIIRECGTSITEVHHIRKPSSKLDEAPPPLEEDPHRWFLQARGSRALVNGSDMRIGMDRPSRASGNSEVALVIGGFGRVRGNIPTTFVARVLDEDDEPLGYDKLAGVRLLFNSEQEEAYRKLLPESRFKDAQKVYGRGAQATTDFLKKCIGVGIMRKDGSVYRKVEVAEQAE